jgi:hypothetical protein
MKSSTLDGDGGALGVSGRMRQPLYQSRGFDVHLIG